MRKIFLVVVVLAVFASADASAETEAGDEALMASFGVSQVGLVNGLELGTREVGVTTENVSSVNSRIGFRVAPRTFLTVGLDFASVSAESEGSTDCYEDFDGSQICDRYDDADASISLFTLEVGAKYYLKDRRVGGVSPFTQTSLTLLIPSADVDNESLEDDLDDAYYFGTRVSLGAEYSVAKTFSVGGQFGAHVILAGYDGERDDLSIMVTDLFTGFDLNFFF